MKLSIIIPVYNVEAYVGECLSSVFDTTASFDDFEVIVVNDGTEDGSMDVVRQFSDRPNLIILEQENLGVSAARNFGLDRAKGEYVWFVDSDDWLVEDGVGKVLRLLVDRPGVEVLVSPLLRSNNNHPKEVELDYQIDHERLMLGKEAFRSGPIQGFGWIMRYVLLRSMLMPNYWLRFPVGLLHEDSYFGAVIMYSAHRVIVLPDPLYYYRVNRPESITSSSIVERSRGRVEVYRRLMVFMIKRVDPEDWNWFRAYCFRGIPFCYDRQLFGQQEFKDFVHDNGKYLYRQWRIIHPDSSIVKKIARFLFFTRPEMYYFIKHLKKK